MKKFLILFALIALISTDDVDLCASTFSGTLTARCQELSSGSERCTYFNNKCQKLYSECRDYTASSTDFDGSICTSITPSNNLMKCYVKQEKGQKTCAETEKDCSDGNKEIGLCTSFKADTGKRCIVLSDGKTCEAHYEACENHNDLHSKALCENNIPKGNDKKCSWESNTCKTADKKCEDEVAVFTDTAANTETTPKSCYDLAHETIQRSIIFYSKDND